MCTQQLLENAAQIKHPHLDSCSCVGWIDSEVSQGEWQPSARHNRRKHYAEQRYANCEGIYNAAIRNVHTSEAAHCQAKTCVRELLSTSPSSP